MPLGATIGAGALPYVANVAALSALGPWYLAGGVLAASCVAAYQPKGALSLAASYINLANPGTNNAAPGVAPTWDAATGWYGDNTKYLATGIIPASGWSAICRFSGLSTGDNDQILFGSYGGASGQYFGCQARYGVVDDHYYFNGGLSTGLGARLTAGVMAIAGASGYLDGLAETTTIPAWGAATTREIYLLAFNNNGSLVSAMTGYIQAVAIYNTILTAPQVAAITNAMNAL